MTTTMRLLKTDWFGLLVAFVCGVLALAATQPTFLSTFNIYVMLTAFSLSVLVALSQMVILAIGQLNLSVGAIGGLAAITFAGVMEVWGLPVPLAILVGLLVGLVCGAINGAVTFWSGLNAFVVTLATLSIYKGINIGITEAQPFYEIPDIVKSFGNARFGAFPYLLIVAGLVLIAMLVFMRRGVLGRQLLAVGGNRNAAELSGIHVGRVIIAAHVISGLLAAVAGMLAVARLQLGQPTIGDDWLIISFAAPVIGGAVLAGGHVSVVGTVLGVAIVTLINNALVLLNVDPFAVQLLLGALILAAVALSRFRDPA
ncbi:ABC transporter permease [Acuticoccus kandeliae]|uniref:ABC transporter permease n=1 Tax=Acuticoccus kandeliae TaxID=2073160 RepID=UPI000D3E67C7|nr:ABC transporter permease [Acuticoccus kandeliae]